MADKKYIKKMNMPVEGKTTELYIKDEEAVTHINGYSNVQLAAQNITFAETPITNDEIDDILNGTITSSTSLD